MPGGDRTGPLGAGPATGRGLGYCVGGGFGFGLRRPRLGRMGNRYNAGRGFRSFNTPYYAPQADSEIQKNYLKDQQQYLKEELRQVQSDLSKIDKGPQE